MWGGAKGIAGGAWPLVAAGVPMRDPPLGCVGAGRAV